MNKTNLIIILIVLVALAVIIVLGSRKPFIPPATELETLSHEEESEDTSVEEVASNSSGKTVSKSASKVTVTDGVKHIIPLDEILSGGPGKDGIPSIDNPAFLKVSEANQFLEDTDPGIGLVVKGEARFYPYRILVWHEIVNDIIQKEPVLVTYCPLCATAIVFERKVDGEVQEFGVSGNLWRSNLLMYNRAAKPSNESLWSQVLGRAVVGIHTEKRLTIIPSDTMRWKDWKKAYPDTKVLSQNTGEARDYGRDPYGDYYTSRSVSFGASFNDNRLHPKAIVHGIEIDEQFKAYHDEAINTEGIVDKFAGKSITITKNDDGEIRFQIDGKPLSSISGFWFSWIAVHPETALLQ